MKKVLLVVALVFVLVTPVFAGDYKCTASTQECLNKMAEKYQDKAWVGIELD